MSYVALRAGENAQWFSAMAIQDRLTATRTFRDVVVGHYTNGTRDSLILPQ